MQSSVGRRRRHGLGRLDDGRRFLPTYVDWCLYGVSYRMRMRGYKNMDNMAPASSQADPDWPELRQQRRAIVVVDVVESVRLMQANEADVIDRWRRFVNEVRTRVLPSHGGRLVKSLGDGLLLEFENVTAAVTCALELQSLIGKYNVGRLASEHFALRVGVNVSEVVVDADDIYGIGVNLAARLTGLASPGEIVVSPEVRDVLVDGLDADLEDMGECYVKHLDEPLRAFRLRRAVAPRLPAFEPDEEPDMRAVVAVVPFEFRGGLRGAEYEAIGELIADGVIALLSKSSSVRLISRLSSSVFRGRAAELETVAQRLGAAYVLSGSYQCIGSRVSLVAEISQAKGGMVVWADRMLADQGDLIQSESELLNMLAAAVAREVPAAEASIARLQPLPSLTGYSLQLGGVSLMHRSAGRDFTHAKAVLEHLTERYPRMALPRAWLAKWYVLRVTRGMVQNAGDEAAIAMDHIRRALDADPSCSLALAMRGFVQCHMLRDLEKALASIDEAIQVNPSDSLGWLFKGVVHSLWGEGKPALDAVSRAQLLSPLDPLQYYYDALAAAAALSAGEWELAVQTARRSLRSNRMHSQNLRSLVIGLVQLGQMGEASQVAKHLLTLEPGLTIAGYLERSPAGANPTRRLYADALARAGVPKS